MKTCYGLSDQLPNSWYLKNQNYNKLAKKRNFQFNSMKQQSVPMKISKEITYPQPEKWIKGQNSSLLYILTTVTKFSSWMSHCMLISCVMTHEWAKVCWNAIRPPLRKTPSQQTHNIDEHRCTFLVCC